MEDTMEALCPKCKIITKQEPVYMPDVCVVIYGQKILVLSSSSICLECHSLIIPANMEHFLQLILLKHRDLVNFLNKEEQYYA